MKKIPVRDFYEKSYIYFWTGDESCPVKKKRVIPSSDDMKTRYLHVVTARSAFRNTEELNVLRDISRFMSNYVGHDNWLHKSGINTAGSSDFRYNVFVNEFYFSDESGLLIFNVRFSEYFTIIEN